MKEYNWYCETCKVNIRNGASRYCLDCRYEKARKIHKRYNIKRSFSTPQNHTSHN